MSMEGLRPSSSGRKPLGKLASRLEEVKNPWRRQGASSLELSHNEAARLATDALLEHGEREYRRVLAEERELNFLSPLELRYISRHAARGGCPGTGEAGSSGGDCGDAVSELTSGTYFPMMSDEEPPLLELGWPENQGRFGPSETQIYFQRDKSHNVKDLIRSLINKAQKVVALVMDVFTDVDLLCDLMEASNKRRVPVYILLDDKNLHYFADMCSMLDIQNTHLSNMRIRSVCGDTYCTKSGKKFSGQVLEKFIIIDCEEVIAGSYSFTWLSAQVHSNMVMHFSGRIADSFDREFRCLYADSQPISCFNAGDDEGGGACYPVYPTYPLVFPSTYPSYPGPQGAQDLLADSRQREQLSSEYSSSQSSGSVSSVKAAPTMTSGTTFKVTLGHDQKELAVSPERRERAGAVRLTTPNAATANGGTNHSASPEHRLPPPYGHTLAAYGQTAGVEWNRAKEGVRGREVGGTAAKFQFMALHDHKGSAKPTGRSSTNQLLNKFTDFFLPQVPPSQGAPPRPPSPWGGPDLSQTEPESKQTPPPPPPLSPTGNSISRQDQKRMTLGHSKLDLVNQYNHRMKGKQRPPVANQHYCINITLRPFVSDTNQPAAALHLRGGRGRGGACALNACQARKEERLEVRVQLGRLATRSREESRRWRRKRRRKRRRRYPPTQTGVDSAQGRGGGVFSHGGRRRRSSSSSGEEEQQQEQRSEVAWLEEVLAPPAGGTDVSVRGGNTGGGGE